MRRVLKCLTLSSTATLVLLAIASPAAADEIPANLVFDIRVFEARSISPDFKTMSSLSFFIDTDGTEISDHQWLATIARQVPDSYLAALAYESIPVSPTDESVQLVLQKRARRFHATVDLASFLPQGVFKTNLTAELTQSDRSIRQFQQEIELNLGRTFVFSSDDLELAASEYVSQFRDYDDREHRTALYSRLREFNIFLVLALTPRIVSAEETQLDNVSLTVPPGAELPDLRSSIGVPLTGVIEVEFLVDADGNPTSANVVRSSIPEVNPRVLGAINGWSFPEAAGKLGHITLELRAQDPR